LRLTTCTMEDNVSDWEGNERGGGARGGGGGGAPATRPPPPGRRGESTSRFPQPSPLPFTPRCVLLAGHLAYCDSTRRPRQAGCAKRAAPAVETKSSSPPRHPWRFSGPSPARGAHQHGNMDARESAQSTARVRARVQASARVQVQTATSLVRSIPSRPAASLFRRAPVRAYGCEYTPGSTPQPRAGPGSS
jgi:hypothetical protein